MAPQEDDFWTRKRKYEEQEEREREAEEERKAKKLKATTEEGIEVNPELAKRIEELTRRAPILFDQLEHLYRQYITGVLARPPIEERGRLDQMMQTMFNMPKPTAGDRFRFGSVWTSYLTHKSRWDKLVADVENGKIKRVAGPKKRTDYQF